MLSFAINEKGLTFKIIMNWSMFWSLKTYKALIDIVFDDFLMVLIKIPNNYQL